MSGKDPRAEAIASALDTALATTLELVPAKDFNDFLKMSGGAARFLRNPKLRMARHFDLAPAFLVLDPTLGSLGIVEMALPSNPRKEKAAVVVQRHVDTATYARHLLLRDRELKGRKALSVELVLLTANETPEERTFFDEIGNALRLAQRDSDSLYHIGVGVLCYSGGEQPFKDRLRRAFPWLLKATHRWFKSDDAKPRKIAATETAAMASLPTAQAPRTEPTPPAMPEPPLRRLRGVTLSNYRLPGTRQLVLTDATVHLVHGANGSGKSSIVEALELVSTGRVDRLELVQEKAYEDVIKNHDAGPGAAATITLAWASGGRPAVDDKPQSVAAGRLPDDVAPPVEASSFRLDQPLMDKLIGRYPHERARDFLRAFFPEARDTLKEYVQSADTWMAKLPAVRKLVETLDLARSALVRHSRWRREAAATGGQTSDYPDLLNRWLERTVILDLLQKERVVQSTLQEARSAEWSSDELSVTTWLSAFEPARDLQAIERHERAVQAEVDALQKALDGYKASTTSVAGGVGTGKVTAAEGRALNDACRWLFDEDVLKTYGLLGDKVVRVLNAGDAPTYGPIIIGGDQWASPLIEQIDALISACKRVEVEAEIKKEEEKKWPHKNASSEYQGALDAHEELIKAGKELSKRFKEHLQAKEEGNEFDGSLIAAINELMALFTPARWGYRDIYFSTTTGDGKVGVDVRVAGERQVRAELHFNTAELNLFTVALFILCATRVNKPLNLLLFDDPLQNMDELTCTALARGLTKVVRLWTTLDRAEELLLLFHGQDDLARFSKEIGAASYRLPWLSPSASSLTDAIVADAEVGKLDAQRIDHLFSVRPGA